MTLPDQKERERIATQLDSCMLVEAAAGTGKTTSMVDRMVELLASGRCSPETLAAITFTRKAAAEMRERFRVELEKRAAGATGQVSERLSEAVDRIGEAYIGTIHSFCARILRERPVEAGVPLDFRELDEDEENRMLQDVWDEHCARLHARGDEVLGRLIRLGVELRDLRSAFEQYVLYPDVDTWPDEPELPLPDFDEVEAELRDYADHIRSLPEPKKIGSSEHVLKVYDELGRKLDNVRGGNLMSLGRILSDFDKEDPNTCKTFWPGESREEQDALREAELERWGEFRRRVVKPFFRAVHQHRYRACLRVLEEAREHYERRRRDSGALNFQDLLLRAARLLREGGAHVRRYFQKRFTHLLVDEFQDTDPVQAEVMMLLTADDPSETDWRRCRPRPGSLFVVGDPKQSIYRFRRADLVTYNEVRRLIERSDGEVVELSSNFRSTDGVINWVNRAFEAQFPDRRSDYSPSYVPLKSGKGVRGTADWNPVEVLQSPSSLRNQQDIAEWEAEVVAGRIKEALDEPMLIRPPSEDGQERAVRAEDFLIITRTKKRMSIYARALEELDVPSQVTGGTVLNEVDALGLLHLCLAAVVRPHNPVAVVAALRSKLFGISDPALLKFAENGGEFDYRRFMPDLDTDEDLDAIAEAFDRLKKYSGWLNDLPPVSTARKVANDLGLPAIAAADRGGNVEAGSLQKAFELLRDAQADRWTPVDMVDYLGELAESEEPQDGLPALTMKQKPVRIMNLHKAKGLQAPIVFLADPSGQYSGDPDMHVDRSGEETAGYLHLEKRVNPYQSVTLAKPPGWDEVLEEEKKFDAAERIRLRYVAATRAGCKLVISRRGKASDKNPWKPLSPYLQDVPELEEPAEKSTDVPEEESIPDAEEFRAARRQIGSDWERATGASYDVRGVKEMHVGERESMAGRRHGTARGEVIHSLLQRRMAVPEAELESLAFSLVRGRDLPNGMVPEMLGVVREVTRSPLWARAMSADRCLVEVPFRLINSDRGMPVIGRGVIDLVFRENDGWVVVDYKTDDTRQNEIGELVDHYAPQLRAYAAAWKRCTGEPTAETGLYFTSAGEYRTVKGRPREES
ncbi:MAG: UvrD-helicase domain-containing protein [Candidatus Brocadiia bacterium]